MRRFPEGTSCGPTVPTRTKRETHIYGKGTCPMLRPIVGGSSHKTNRLPATVPLQR